MNKALYEKIGRRYVLWGDVGLLTPIWWEHKSAYEIAQAAIDVVSK
jgi:hypothetical protein